MMASRVTVDLDAHIEGFRMQCIRAYHELKRLADRVDVRISSSGEGIHLVGWFSSRLSEDEKRSLRRHLGDDPNRLRLDELPSWHRKRAVNNVLWSKKGAKTADEDFDDIYSALDYIADTRLAERFENDVKRGLVV